MRDWKSEGKNNPQGSGSTRAWKSLLHPKSIKLSEQTEKSTALLGCMTGRHWATAACPQDWRDRQMNIES